MPTRLMITLTSNECEALAQMAYAELRDPREQLRYLLRQAAQQRGLFPIDEITNERKEMQHEQPAAAHA